MQTENVGVVIPPSTIEDSNTKKMKSKKTLAQLPVYRDAANLKYIVTALLADSPRKLTKFYDQMLATVSELKKSIGMADISRNPTDRVWYLECARVLMQDVSDDFTTLRKLEVMPSKDLDNKAKALVKKIIAQLVAWRDYTSGEGVKS
ncbi:MAG: hypothetical protein IKO85_04935 [Bacteroidaceae bacterium]|nr:hypothetical protein [Bacteroidaceae bacterium]